MQNSSTLISLDDLLKMKVTKQVFLLEPLLPQVGVAMLYGPSDSGKSFFCRQLSISITNGDPDFLGFPITAVHKSVLHLVTEEIDQNGLGYKAHIQSKGITSNNPTAVKYLIALKDAKAELEREMLKRKYDLVIVDGWADTVKGDINQLHVARTSTLDFRDLALKHQCSILLIHHVNKSGQDNMPNKRYLSGSHGIEASVRSLFELRKGGGDDKLLTVVKGNDMKDDVKDGHFFLETDENMVYSMRNFEGRGFIAGKPKNERFFDNQELCEAALTLRKEGKTFEEIHQILKDTFPDNPPGLTSIKTWFSKEGNARLSKDQKEGNKTD